MTLNEFLIWVIAVQIGMFLLGFVAVMLHSFWAEWASSRLDEAWQLSRPQMAKMMLQNNADEEFMQRFDKLSGKNKMVLVKKFGDQFSGEQGENIGKLSKNLGATRIAREWCRSSKWGKRAYGAQFLAMVEPADSLVEELLRDPHVEVRKIAYGWLAGAFSQACWEDILERWQELSFEERSVAKDALSRSGEAAIDVLQMALNRMPDDVDLLEVATSIADPSYLDVARIAMLSDNPRARRNGAILWCYIRPIDGNKPVEELLLNDPDEEVRLAIARSFAAIGDLRTGKALEKALDDESWRVRYEVAQALVKMGPPGIVRLELAKNDGGARAKTANFALALAEV